MEYLLQKTGAPENDSAVQKESINFAESDESRLLINQYVKDQTNNLITNFLPEDVINPLTKLYLVNTLYLKVKKIKKFNIFK